MKNAHYVQVVALSLIIIASFSFGSQALVQNRSQLAAVAGSGSGLTAYYTFDEGSGTSASDGAGTYGATLFGATWTSGKIGSALQFAGPADHVDTASITGNASDYSVTGWFKTGNTSGSNAIISWGTMGCRFNYSSPGILNCYVNNSSTGSAKSTQSLTDNTWHHFVFTNSGSIQTLYIDGVQVSTATQVGGSVTGRVRFGLFWGSTSGGFVGTLDEMRIYDHALTQSDVSELYAVTTSQATTQQGGSTGGTTGDGTGGGTTDPPAPPTNPGTLPTGNLLLNYSFNEGSGSTVADSSGNGNTGSLVNSPLWSNGVSGSALKFDGIGSYVSATPSMSLVSGTTGSAVFSTSVWIKPDVFTSASIYSRQILGLGASLQNGGWNIVYEPTHYSTPEGAKYDFTSGHIRFYYADSSSDQSITNNTTELAMNTWHHIVTTLDQPNHTAKIFVDGALKTTLTNLSGTITPPSTSVFTVGSNKSNITGGTLNGSIDDVEVFGRILTDSEIQSLYATGLSLLSGDNLPPNVSVTSPSQFATVSGQITLSASASDNSGIAGVQFKVDGQNVGGELTSAPYTYSWNSSSVSNGTHTISARARDTAGNQTASAWTSITVNNTVAAGSVTPVNGIYTVNIAGGTNVFTRIQDCANVVQAGQTCLVYPGTYPEHVTTKSGGTSDSNRVIFKTQGSVSMQGFDVKHAYVTLDGFDMTDYYTTNFVGIIDVWQNADYLNIFNNTLRENDGVHKIYGVKFERVSGDSANNAIVRGNTFARLNSQYFILHGSNHLIEQNTMTEAHQWDPFYVFGSNHIIRRNIFWNAGVALGGNHPDYVQTFSSDGEPVQHILFEENWVQDLPEQFCQMNSSDNGVGILQTNVKDFIFRRNVIINTHANCNIDVPEVTFENNTIYRNATAGIGFVTSGSLTRGDSYSSAFRNNILLEGGTSPATINGSNGFYTSDGFLFTREAISFYVTNEGICSPSCPIATGIADDMILNKYIDGYTNGHILSAARALTSINDMQLSATYSAYKSALWTRLQESITHDNAMKSTFYADYNYVAGAASAGYPAKKSSGCIAGTPFTPSNFCEPHGINGGDPKFQNINNPLGPDGVPFTLDDGLKPLSSSILCGKGSGGTDIGAFSCTAGVVFSAGAGGTISNPPPPPVTPKVGDFNNDGVVNSIDLSLMAGSWNQNNATYDLNKDGTVNTLDYTIMVRNWTL